MNLNVDLNDVIVSFETAMLLKQKCYNGEADGMYDREKNYIPCTFDRCDALRRYEFPCYAPNIQQVLVWIKDKHVVDITVETVNDNGWKWHTESVVSNESYETVEEAFDVAIQYILTHI